MDNIFKERRIRQDTDKLKEIILYIGQKWADAELCGSTKLNKVLFAIDFDAYYELGNPVTGMKYKKGEFGPRAFPLLPVIKAMIKEGILNIEEEPIGDEKQYRPIPCRRPNMNIFSKAELEIIDKWIAKFKNKSARWVRDWSHDFDGWKKVGDNEDIPYLSIFWGQSLSKPITQEEIERGKKVLKLIEDGRIAY